jgi:hypothetical protein
MGATEEQLKAHKKQGAPWCPLHQTRLLDEKQKG